MIKLRLKNLLEERGQSLYWLSAQSGVRYATIWKMGRGEVGRLNLNVLDRICEALDCQPGDLLVKEKKTKSRKTSSRRGR